MGFPGGSVVKNPPAVQEMMGTHVRSLGQEDPLEEEMAAHSRILSEIIPRGHKESDTTEQQHRYKCHTD